MVWLAFAGLFVLWFGPTEAGPLYDAYLHAIFVGFIFAMIFGHAPLIFPAILSRQANYHPALYLPLILLHISLILRLVRDLALTPAMRRWGGLLNGVTILVYLAATALMIIRSASRQ